MTKYFSKSDFVHGEQCPKYLWMQTNKKEAFDAKWLDTAKLSMGTDIGNLARSYYGNYELVRGSFAHPEKMAEKTQLLISQGVKTICEATFLADGCICLVDLLRVLPNHTLELVEVKSSTSVKPEHLVDTSFQRAVVQAAMPGWSLQKVSLMHINSNYVREGELDIHRLFQVDDVTDKLIASDEVMEKVTALKSYMALSEEPQKEIGKHCNSPHACPYQGYCLRGRDDSICELAGRGRAKGFELIAKGITSFEDALKEMELNGLALTQAGTIAKGETRYCNTEKLRKFMEAIHFPLYFLDFESIQAGVPIWDGTRPYQQIATQFSLHWLDEEGGELHHAEYLAAAEGDPRRGVAEALVSLIPEGACVTAYNMGFEKGRIKEMAEAFPTLSTRLIDIHNAIVDLMIPFQKGWVYLTAMGGSYSIKHVLPALYPNDPELDYHALVGVHCGTEATLAFLKLASLPADEQEVVREQLLRYCELDTLAMVKVWEALKRFAA